MFTITLVIDDFDNPFEVASGMHMVVTELVNLLRNGSLWPRDRVHLICWPDEDGDVPTAAVLITYDRGDFDIAWEDNDRSRQLFRCLSNALADLRKEE